MSQYSNSKVSAEIYRRLQEKTKDPKIIKRFMLFFKTHDTHVFFKGDEEQEAALINFISGGIEQFQGELKRLFIECYIYDLQSHEDSLIRFSGDSILYNRAIKYLKEEEKKIKEYLENELRNRLRAKGEVEFEKMKKVIEEELLEPYDSIQSKIEYLSGLKSEYEGLISPSGGKFAKASFPPINPRIYPSFWCYTLLLKYVITKIEFLQKIAPETEKVRDQADRKTLTLAMKYLLEAGSMIIDNASAGGRLMSFFTGFSEDTLRKVWNAPAEEDSMKAIKQRRILRELFTKADLPEVVKLIDNDANS